MAKNLNVLEQVHLLGYRNDIVQLNHCSDAFCFPSHREGLGLGAIEAMSSGLPIITSNVHGINDYSNDGVTGYKCAPTDVDGFANAILKLVQDKESCLQFGLNNKDIAKKYSVENIIEMMRKIYEL